MNQLPSPSASTSTSLASVSLFEPARSKSPIKRTSVVGDSSTFLTALAAQERQVLELREELQKAEESLTRLKKQWASHEVIKKRNEFRQRQREQLQPLEPASRISLESVRTPDDARASFEVSNCTPRASSDVDGRSSPGGEEKPRRQNSTRQMQRRVFAGSRQTKTLSLLSKIGNRRISANQATQELLNAPEPANRKGASPLKQSKTLSVQPSPGRNDTGESAKGQPKEVFIETGKQLVGDLRDGLWTLFEDLRQATVGEEATGNPDHNSKMQLYNGYSLGGKEGRPGKGKHTPQRQPRKINRQQPGSEADQKLVELPCLEQGTVSESSQSGQREVASRFSPQQQAEEIDDSEGEGWHNWGTPAASYFRPHEQAESVTSDSLASSWAGRNSPRSSMR